MSQLHDEHENGSPPAQAVFESEYGAQTPAGVRLSTLRWTARHWQFPLLMLAIAAVSAFLMVKVISGFLWPLLISLFLLWRNWNGVRHSFLHGNANPGRIVSVNPPLVAVWTDMGTGGPPGEEQEGDNAPEYPAVKVFKYPLKTVLGAPLEWGQPVPTASIYAGDEKRLHWTDFKPVVLEEGCGDFERLHATLCRIPEENWGYLDAAVQTLTTQRKLKPGLYRLWRE